AQLQKLTSSTLSSASALTAELRAGASTADLQAKLQALFAQLTPVVPAKQSLADAVQANATKAVQASTQMTAVLGAEPFTVSVASEAVVHLAEAAVALQSAIAAIARDVGRMDDADPKNRMPDVEAAVLGILAPWTAPLRAFPAGAGSRFDALAKQLV